MANKQRGEVPLTVGDRVYTLVLDFEAMEHIEEAMSTPERVVTAHHVLFQVLSRKYPPFTHSRVVLHAALRRHHPTITAEQTRELIDEMGGTEHVVTALLGVYNAASPDKEDVNGRPQQARQPLTGEPITFSRAASASRRKRSG